MNEILETYTMTPEEEIKYLRQCVRELQQKNNSLKTRIKTIKRRRQKQTQKIKKYKELITNMNNSLNNKQQRIDKAMGILKEHFVEEYVRSCDTEDGIGRYEVDTDHWIYETYQILKGEPNNE